MVTYDNTRPAWRPKWPLEAILENFNDGILNKIKQNHISYIICGLHWGVESVSNATFSDAIIFYEKFKMSTGKINNSHLVQIY